MPPLVLPYETMFQQLKIDAFRARWRTLSNKKHILSHTCNHAHTFVDKMNPKTLSPNISMYILLTIPHTL